jgi:hypothetical protein
VSWLPSRWLEGPPQSPSPGPHHHVQCSLLTLLSHSTLISLLSLTFHGGKLQSLRPGCCCREPSQQHISVLFMLCLATLAIIKKSQ